MGGKKLVKDFAPVEDWQNLQDPLEYKDCRTVRGHFFEKDRLLFKAKAGSDGIFSIPDNPSLHQDDLPRTLLVVVEHTPENIGGGGESDGKKSEPPVETLAFRSYAYANGGMDVQSD